MLSWQKQEDKELKKKQEEEKKKEKELKRQEEEARKEKKMKEREAAERKQQIALQKQASIMDRLFRRKEPETAGQNGELEVNGSTPSPLQESSPWAPCTPPSEERMARMDQELGDAQNWNTEDLFRCHLSGWKDQRKHIAPNRLLRWGLRRKPKVTVYRALRLHGASVDMCRKNPPGTNEQENDRIVMSTPSPKRSREEFEEAIKLDVQREEIHSLILNGDPVDNPRKKLCTKPWKLLQFDKAYRPAYYGTFSKKSETVRPRRPLNKDPSLNYEVDSDEEWEEEDPGESLSDCEDKEDDIDKANSEVDEESADGFVVPDGYLSENEGVHLEDSDFSNNPLNHACGNEENGGQMWSKQADKEQEVRTLDRLRNLLDDATQHALRCNRPFLVSILMQQSTNQELKPQLPANCTERLCLQALSMQIAAAELVIEPPDEVASGKEFTKGVKSGRMKARKARRREPSLYQAIPV